VKNKLQPAYISWRFYLSLVGIGLVVIGLISRIVDLAIFKQGFLQHEGDVRVLRTVNTSSFRGMITDRNGNPLAISTAVYSVWINPQEFTATKTNLNILGQALSLKLDKEASVIEHEKLKHREFVYLKRGIAPEAAAKIKTLAVPGVYLQDEYKRFYPEGEIAAHLIGFTNVDDKGQEGLELAYNQWLAGLPGKKLVIKDRLGRVISDVRKIQEQKPGGDLVLSIDKRIQYLAYRELMEGVQKNVAASGSVIVMDVKTGEILAMANLPSFNPNNRPAHGSDVYRNRALTDTFEPGSTIKAFSIASALDGDKYKPESEINTFPGWMKVDRHIVRDEHNNGVLTVAQILQLSSNVGTTKMILTLPPQQLWKILHSVGFGESTGIGFPGEQTGSLVNRPRWSPFTLATLSFGYGISVTPMQLAQAYSIFANDGIKVPITLLRQDKAPNGERVINAKLANEMLNLLESVTTAKRATGELARVPGYRVAGKTGTAIMAGPHGYQKHHYTSSFVGIAPVSNPRLVVAVVLHDPRGKHYYASFVSAPVFEKIMEGALRIMNVPPDDLAALNKPQTIPKSAVVAALPHKSVLPPPVLDE
jgi:cell division protein FtsI (penicillin-binding protein 3)